MEVNSNKYDTYTWVIKVIESSTSIEHIRSCRNLLANFDKTYNDNGLWDLLHDCLDIQRKIIWKNTI